MTFRSASIDAHAYGISQGLILDGRVDPSGTFKLAGIPFGTYVLVVRRHNEILLARPVKMSQNESLNLSLPGH